MSYLQTDAAIIASGCSKLKGMKFSQPVAIVKLISSKTAGHK